MQRSAPATLVLAGVLDGSAMVTKHATASAAIRNGMLWWALGDKVPVDSLVSAIPKMEMRQLLAEWLIKQRVLVDKEASETAPQQPELIPDLDPVDFSSRRLFDGLPSEVEGEETLLEKATTLNMPFKTNSKTVWYNFRQPRFNCGRKRQQGFERKMLSKSPIVRSGRCRVFRVRHVVNLGGPGQDCCATGGARFNDHGTAEGWKTLLRHVVS